MELLVVLLVVGAVAFLIMRTQSTAIPRRPQVDPEQLSAVRRAVDEDVTVFGEELQHLGNEMAGTPLDEGTRADYQRAAGRL
jgi:hypothetical protein